MFQANQIAQDGWHICNISLWAFRYFKKNIFFVLVCEWVHTSAYAEDIGCTFVHTLLKECGRMGPRPPPNVQSLWKPSLELTLLLKSHSSPFFLSEFFHYCLAHKSIHNFQSLFRLKQAFGSAQAQTSSFIRHCLCCHFAYSSEKRGATTETIWNRFETVWTSKG